jgi:hypothetical protein
MAAACRCHPVPTRTRMQVTRHHITALVPSMPTQLILNILNKAVSMLALPALCSPMVDATPRPNWNSDEELGILVLILATRSALLRVV